MKKIIPLPKLDLGRIETLAFAGGGNRCWWQGGLVEQLMAHGWRLPRQLVGTSAGAAVAAACLSAGPVAALDACRQLYADNKQLWDWRGLKRFQLKFAHQHIYPAWVESFVTPEHFDAIRRSGSELLVAVTHPARWLGLKGSVAAASVAYLLDKKMLHSIHPRLPGFLGLRQGFFKLSQCSSALDARTLLQGAAAALPFMPAQRVAGRWAMDGGYTDNAPLPTQTPAEKASTLVLLTRHYPQLPTLFQWRGRSYWQPSQKIPVSTWDCRPTTTVREAFELGRADAKRWLAHAVRFSSLRPG